MLYLDGFLGLVMLGLWIFCIIDVITTPPTACRNLPKIAWLLLVLLLPEVGSIVWLIGGRPWDQTRRNQSVPPAPGYREYQRLGRAVPINPDDDEEFLRQCRERAEDQRRRYQQGRDVGDSS